MEYPALGGMLRRSAEPLGDPMTIHSTNNFRTALKSSASFGWSKASGIGVGLLLALPLFASPALANPLSASVTTGSASIVTSSNKTQIDQKSEDVVIDWSSFNIGAGQTTRFVQPNAQAIAVNRIGGNSASQILGALDANGRIVLINGNGMLFGNGSQVNVGSLVATSTGGSDSDVLNGKFTQASSQNSAIVNQGRITTSQGGLVALVAPSVTNAGTVNAKFGTVAVGAANKFIVDFTGDGLVSFATRGDVNSRATATNTGALVGANVSLTAHAAESVATGVVTMSGIVVAQTAKNVGGTILLDAGDGGDTIVARAKLDASGRNGGGEIAIGGWNEASATVDKSSVLSASAGRNGNGGNIAVIANATSFEGRANAQGGKTSGNGGTIETSGYVVDALNARIDTLAPHGAAGLWSLDPENVAISNAATTNGSITGGIFTPSGDNSILNVATLESALVSGNVEVTTGGTGSLGSQAGNITVTAPISWSTNTLTLDAFGAITINKTIGGSGATLDLIAGSTIGEGAIGIIDVTTLTGSSTAATLTGANQIANLGAFTVAGGMFALRDDQNLSIDGLVNGGTHIVRLVDTGTIGESGSGAIEAGALKGSSSGGTALNGANQIADLDTFTNSGAGGFALTNVGTLTVDGEVNAGTGNLSLSARAISQQTGNIVMAGEVMAGGTVNLVTNDAITHDSAGIIVANTLTVSSGYSVNLTAANRIANLGAFTPMYEGNFSLADTENLSITGVVDAGTRTATLTDTGSISESGAGAIIANTFEGASAGGATLNGANQIITIKGFANTGAGGFTLEDAVNGTLTVTSAINAGSGNLSLTTTAFGTNIAIDAPITAGGIVTLLPVNLLSQNSAGIITAGTLTGSAATATLTAANQISNLGSFATVGDFSLTNARSLTVSGTVAAGAAYDMTLQVTSGDLDISGALDIAADQDGDIVTLGSTTGQVYGTGTITANMLNVTADTGIDLTGPNSIGTIGTNHTNSGPDVINNP
jgi:filamentous hemagglutinin family protein